MVRLKILKCWAKERESALAKGESDVGWNDEGKSLKAVGIEP